MYNPNLIFIVVFAALFFAIVFLDHLKDYKGILRDDSTEIKKPYSWARVQIAWWTIIVLSSFITIMISKNVIPTLDQSTIILLAISAGTLASGRLVDQSSKKDDTLNEVNVVNSQKGKNLFVDILSDAGGINIHRFQTVVFNLAFGIYFISVVINNLNICPRVPSISDCDTLAKLTAHSIKESYNLIMPKISQNNLILLGLSSATYAALKTTENK